ncbi:MAG: hypothetical protein GC134_04830 [Proteobacteria bacterium]|nr:hypothetical protein [Pseudomonadota bacterium]
MILESNFKPKKLSPEELTAHLNKMRRERAEKESKQAKKYGLFLILMVLIGALVGTATSDAPRFAPFVISGTLLAGYFCYRWYVNLGPVFHTPAEQTAEGIIASDIKRRKTQDKAMVSAAVLSWPIYLGLSGYMSHLLWLRTQQGADVHKLASLTCLLVATSALLIVLQYRAITVNRYILHKMASSQPDTPNTSSPTSAGE